MSVHPDQSVTERRVSSTASATVEREHGVVRVPRLLLWYRADFGGRSGMLAFLRRYGVLTAEASPRVRYLEWDWSLARGQFAE